MTPVSQQLGKLEGFETGFQTFLRKKEYLLNEPEVLFE